VEYENAEVFADFKGEKKNFMNPWMRMNAVNILNNSINQNQH